ncbi:MAG: aminotransferase class V-fold PLP-dependent enzyme, partial [Alphaproteobacteria bacterium]|nr:aminotransferase class V-fold PLP-dependent enzyme [Alphaproteobacteria bacterium]
MIYLDHNATSPLRPEARDAMLRALDIGGNPSSVHAAGRGAHKTIEDARECVAAFAGALPGEVIFTSGGAEANALALRGAIAGAGETAQPIKRLYVQATAHDSVRTVAASLVATVPGLQLCEIPVDAYGRIKQDALAAQLVNGEGRALVSLLYLNNETGVTDDVAALVAVVRGETNALIHVDAVSSGYCQIRLREWDADYLSLSAHKIGGPQGAGALIARDGAPLAPLFNGFQEMRRRGGTENVAAIAGFGAATSECVNDSREKVSQLRDRFERGVRAIAPHAIVFGEGAPRLSNTS